MPTSQTPKHPTLRDLVMLDIPAEVRISPDGRKLAALLSTTDWRENRHEYRCLIYDSESGEMRPLTRSGHVEQVEWLDDRTLAVLKSSGDEKTQVFLYEGLLGDGWLSMAVATGLALGAMQVLRVIHPPAGANPMVVIASQATPDFLLTPVLAGSVAIVLVALLVNNLRKKNSYPRYW